MPLDITVKSKEGKIFKYYIPLDLMRGEKKGDRFFDSFATNNDWTWTNPNYQLKLDVDIMDVESIEIDASKRLADVDRSNNVYPRLMKPVEVLK